MGNRQSLGKNKKKAARHVAAVEVKQQESVRKVTRDAAVKKRATGCGCQSSDPAGLVTLLVLGAFGFFRPRGRNARQ